MGEPTLSFRQVSKFYPGDGGRRFAMRDVRFEVPQGRAVAITGRSGSGKSTLLHPGAQSRATLLLVTHSQELAALAEQTWRLHSGVLET